MSENNTAFDLAALKDRFKDGMEWLDICNEMLDNLMCGVVVYELLNNNTLRVLYLNDTYYDIIGYNKEECSKSPSCILDVLLPDSRTALLAKAKESTMNNVPLLCEVQAKRADGEQIWLLIKAARVHFIDCERFAFLAVVQDVTERKNRQLEMAVYREKNMILKEVLNAVLFDYDLNSGAMTFYYKNKDGKEEPLVLKNYLAYSRKSNIVHPEDSDIFFEGFAQLCELPDKRDLIYRSTVLDRTDYRWVKTTCSSIADDTGKVVKLVGIIQNIDEEYRESQRMSYLVETDATTGLYNKLTAMTRIQEKLARASEGVNCFAVIDIDNFKGYNDTYGHSYGDEVLLAVASALSRCFPDAVLGRFGGDEYILYMNIEKTDSVKQAFENFMQLVRQIKPRENKCEIRCCCGVAFTKDLSVDYATLFDSADALLYKAKNGGKDCVVYEEM